MSICKLEKISKTYKDKVVLNNFDLEIKQGEFISITGKSGSGKSTILNIIGMIDQADSGKVMLFGAEATKKKRQAYLRTKISYLFQNFALIDNETIEQNLDIALAYTQINKKDKLEIMKKTLAEVGLSNISLKQKVYSLSGGEQQRISLARTLLKPSELILADEPTGSLDNENRNAILNILASLNAQGKTIVIVTHDMEVASFCKRNVFLSET